jgi:crotonobetainyl-CoA:carnitine CoA-transferase CaiB-like acyl-CoA transferase
VPTVQLADVTTGLLALSSILAALLSRQRTGKGLHIDQPIALSPLPFVAWNLAEASVGDESFIEGVLGGQTPTYRRYRCADGREITLGAIEPKFWSRIVDLLGIPEHAGDGLSASDRGQLAAKALEERFATQSSEHWVKLGEQEGLPITPLRTLKEVLDSPYYSSGGRLVQIPAGDSGSLCAPASILSPFRREPSPAPRLGEGNVRIASEFGLDS